MLPMAIPNLLSLNALSVLDTADQTGSFVTMGPCTVETIWHRPTHRVEGCGKDCQHDVCYDEYILEFGWSGEPVSDAFTVDPSQILSVRAPRTRRANTPPWRPATEPCASRGRLL